jgi:hypothetical protein
MNSTQFWNIKILYLESHALHYESIKRLHKKEIPFRHKVHNLFATAASQAIWYFLVSFYYFCITDPIMSQSDFASLAVRFEIPDEDLHSNGAEAKMISASKQSVLPSHARDEENAPMEEYTAVNFIPEEVYAFFAAREASNLITTSASDRLDLDAVSAPDSQNLFEPPRRLKAPAPPKRFFRTFWRSAARRILALSNARTM